MAIDGNVTATSDTKVTIIKSKDFDILSISSFKINIMLQERNTVTQLTKEFVYSVDDAWAVNESVTFYDPGVNKYFQIALVWAIYNELA